MALPRATFFVAIATRSAFNLAISRVANFVVPRDADVTFCELIHFAGPRNKKNIRKLDFSNFLGEHQENLQFDVLHNLLGKVVWGFYSLDPQLFPNAAP